MQADDSISRQGSASVFQITCHKNLNGFHRVCRACRCHLNCFANMQIDGVPTHAATQTQTTPARKISPVISHEDMWAAKTA